MEKRKIIVILLSIAVYIGSTIASYTYFSHAKAKSSLTSPVVNPSKDASGKITFDTTLPKTEACPLNGAYYSKQQRDWWEQHRPLGVMIENHEDARPQSGLSSADIIYEAVAEGGITRFLAIFYCQDANTIGPVRSARTYFLDFISEYGSSPLYAHVGGANTAGPADALGQIEDYGWEGYNDMNQFSIGFPTFWRDYDRLGHATATEHTMYSTTTKLWDFARKSRGLTNVDKKGVAWNENFIPFSFKEDAAASQRPASQEIHIEFWEKYRDYLVDWSYDPKTNTYSRKNAGVVHLDKNTEKGLTTKNIVVLSMIESNANDGYENNLHLLYKTKGQGKAAFFIDGKRVDGTWRKDSRTARMQLFDSTGTAIKFDRGTIWFEILPTDGILTVK